MPVSKRREQGLRYEIVIARIHSTDRVMYGNDARRRRLSIGSKRLEISCVQSSSTKHSRTGKLIMLVDPFAPGLFVILLRVTADESEVFEVRYPNRLRLTLSMVY